MFMITQLFRYNEKDRELYSMKEDSNFIEGVDLSAMSEEEKTEFTAIVDTFYENIQPFIKTHYRRFSREKVLNPQESLRMKLQSRDQ